MIARLYHFRRAAFSRRVSEGPQPLMEVRQHLGIEAAPALIANLAAGSSDPAMGHMLIF